MNGLKRGKSWIVLIATLIMLSGLAPHAHAQVPMRMDYQGYLTDSEGTPVNGTVSMTFSLYAASGGGAPLWWETQSVGVFDGVYSVVLGKTTPLSPSHLVDPLYLGVKVGTDAEMTPRRRITSAAFAINAARLDGQDASAFASIDHDHSFADITGSATDAQIPDSITVTHSSTAGDAETLQGQTPSDFAVATHFHDERYYTEQELSVSGGGGTVHWDNLGGVPAGFSDDVDNDSGGDITGVTAGAGLSGGGTIGNVTLSAAFAGSGSASTVARSDHDHNAGYWSLNGNTDTTGGNFLGTSDNSALELRVNNLRAMRLEPTETSPNIIGGYVENNVTAGVRGGAIGGGGNSVYINRVTDGYGTVAGGADNQAGDGAGTTSDASGATVAGGFINTASAPYAMVAGGRNNTASGAKATVAGGGYNTAAGSYSFAAGHRAKANHDGSFVLTDSTSSDFASVRDDALRVRFNGGATFVVNDGYWVRFWRTGTHLIDASNGAHLTTGGTWTNGSDRNDKENLATVDAQAVLARLAQVPILSWSYKVEDPSIRHMGPMAQDLYAAFGLGESDKTITTIDADGVALAAIQGLNQVVKEKEAVISGQAARIETLEKKLARLEALVGRFIRAEASLWQ